MGIITDPSQARHAVLERDRGICCDCGEDWREKFKLVPLYRDRETGQPRVTFAQAKPGGDAWPQGYYVSTCSYQEPGYHPFVELTAISLWHVDHKVPLWKARHLPDLKRLEYFKLANLITRCHRCHEFKTIREAGDRAKFNRSAEPAPEKPKRKWPAGRKMQSRPFQKPRGKP